LQDIRAMDWDDLRIFLAVARSESLSGAGKRLKIDPPPWAAASPGWKRRWVQRLFAKSPQGYALTEEGTRLLPHAERAETALDGAREALSGPEGLSGQIRIGAPDGCANYLLPQVLAPSATPIRGWRCRSWHCPASSTCPSARPIWPSPSAAPRQAA
jgi:DNA-binding transcriptional LysR family regulator